MFLILFIYATLLLSGCGSGNVNESKSTPAPDKSAQKESQPKASANIENGAIGTIYTVNYISSRYEVVLVKMAFIPPQNQYINKNYFMAYFEIKNIGEKSEYFAPNIYLVDPSQEKYDKTIAFINDDEYSKTLDFLKQLPPNTKMSGWVAFEVPESFTSGSLYFEYSNPYIDKEPKYIRYGVTVTN